MTAHLECIPMMQKLSHYATCEKTKRGVTCNRYNIKS